MWRHGGESARGLHAIRVLQNKKDFTLDSLIAAAYDSYLPWFEKPMPALIKAWDATPRFQSAEGEDWPEQIALLRNWDLPLGRRAPFRPRSRCSGARRFGGTWAAADADRAECRSRTAIGAGAAGTTAAIAGGGVR